jgi:hypothetical protein
MYTGRLNVHGNVSSSSLRTPVETLLALKFGVSPTSLISLEPYRIYRPGRFKCSSWCSIDGLPDRERTPGI